MVLFFGSGGGGGGEGYSIVSFVFHKIWLACK